jgi:hypothetical protein
MTGNPNSAGILVYTGIDVPDEEIVLYSPQNPFPTEPISYCWDIKMTVSYDDGSCCIFIDYGCVQLG